MVHDNEFKGTEKSMNYYICKQKKTRVYLYAYFVDSKDKKKVIKKVSVEATRKRIPELQYQQQPITREKEAILIIEKALQKGLICFESDIPRFVDYVFAFWDFDNSAYIKKKNFNKANSIGRDHVRNMLLTFKKNLLPLIPQSLLVNQVTTRHIEDWKLSLAEQNRLQRATLIKVMQSIAVPLREAYRNDLIQINPMDKVLPITADAPKEKGIFSVQEIQGILKYLLERTADTVFRRYRLSRAFYLMNALAVLTGMRMGEVRAITIDQIAFVDETSEVGVIHIDKAYSDVAGEKLPKGKKTRYVSAPRWLLQEMLEQAALNPLDSANTRVFWSDKMPTQPYQRSVIEKHTIEAIHAIGIAEEVRQERFLTFHSYRHTYNSRLRDEVPETLLRAVVGHESDVMTNRYTHQTQEQILSVGMKAQEIFNVEVQR